MGELARAVRFFSGLRPQIETAQPARASALAAGIDFIESMNQFIDSMKPIICRGFSFRDLACSLSG
jgi:hypothetical protein